MARTPLLAVLTAVQFACLAPAQEFRRAFDQAASLGDRAAMTKVISGQKGFEEALDYGRYMLEQLALKPDQRSLLDRFELLNEVVQTTHKSKVLAHMERFYRERGKDVLEDLKTLNVEYNRLFSRYRAGMQGDQEAWNEAFPGFQALAKKFEEVGDQFFAANSYQVCLDLLKKAAGPGKGEKEFAAVEGFLRTREAWDLTRDQAFEHFKNRYRHLEQLKSEGKSLDEDPAAQKPEDRPAAGPELAYMPDSKWEKFEGVFKPWEQVDRGVYQMSATSPLLWRGFNILGLLGEGEEKGIGKIPFAPEIQMLRSKANLYELDSDMDGKPDERVKLGAKPQLTIFDRTLEGEKTKGALFFWTGGAQENLSGLSINLEPQPGPNAHALVYYRGATAMEVEFKGQKLLFIDENATGTFGDSPVGIGAPRYAPYGVMVGDSMLLPGMKSPVPFSDFIKVGDGYYKFKFTGMTARVRQLDMSKTPLGMLRLEFKGPASAKPRHLIVGERSAFVGAYFDLAANPKGVEVPAGKYQIIGGLIVTGSGPRMRSASIGMGKAPLIDVKPGEEAKIVMGAPYTFEFTYVANPARVNVDGMSVKVHGAGGEVYLDAWEGVPEPDVLVRKDDKSPLKKLGSMGPPGDGEAVNAYRRAKDNKISIPDAIFAPMDFSAPNPIKGPVQIRLVQAKHSYFGKVESDWK